MANLIDGTDNVDVWARLHINDLPIRNEGGTYNPDFLVAARTDRCGIETKADRDLQTENVQETPSRHPLGQPRLRRRGGEPTLPAGGRDRTAPGPRRLGCAHRRRSLKGRRMPRGRSPETLGH